MELNRVGNTDLQISPITLGTWVFGGKFWGGANEEHCIEAVHYCLDHGINCIDTAPIYGNGKSEEIVGKAIEGRRNKVVLATKCGIVEKDRAIGHDLTPQSIVKELEDSLCRLNTDYIDLYQCHWPDVDTPIENTLETLSKLQEEGKIRYIGLSNYSVEQMEEACKYADIVTSQNSYSLFDRSVEDLLHGVLRNKNIGLLAYGPLAGGILTGKYKSEPEFAKSDARNFFYKYYQGYDFQCCQQIVDELRIFNKPLNQLAINWVRQQEGVTSVLVGCRNVAQAQKNIAALDWELSEDQLNSVNDIIGKQ